MKHLILTLLFCLVSVQTAFAVDEKQHPVQKIQLKSVGGVTVSEDDELIQVRYTKPVPVSDLLPTIARTSGKVALAKKNAGQVKVKVTFDEALPKDEAFAVIVKALEDQGLEVHESDDKVVVSEPAPIRILQSLRVD